MLVCLSIMAQKEATHSSGALIDVVFSSSATLGLFNGDRVHRKDYVLSRVVVSLLTGEPSQQRPHDCSMGALGAGELVL